ncbi:MAG TPA: hypothetical protein VEU32_20840 [Burkholderiales bacterium]|nr:hypothetical protein [Burkholderiales bacterium]
MNKNVLFLVASIGVLAPMVGRTQPKWGGNEPAPATINRPAAQPSGPGATLDLNGVRIPAGSIGGETEVFVEGTLLVGPGQLGVPDQGAVVVFLRSRGVRPLPGAMYGTAAGTYRVRFNIAAPQASVLSPKPPTPGALTVSLEPRGGPGGAAATIVSTVGQPTFCEARSTAQACDLLVSTTGGASVVVKAAGSRGTVAVQSVQVFKEK